MQVKAYQWINIKFNSKSHSGHKFYKTAGIFYYHYQFQLHFHYCKKIKTHTFIYLLLLLWTKERDFCYILGNIFHKSFSKLLVILLINIPPLNH